MPSRELKVAQKRWEAQYEAIAARVERQKASIDRLLEANGLQNALLHELAEDESLPLDARMKMRAVIDGVNQILTPAAEGEDEGD